MFLSFAHLINFANPKAPKGLIRSAEKWVDEHCEKHVSICQPQPIAYYKKVSKAEENIYLIDKHSPKSPFDEFQNVRWTVTPEMTLFYLQGARLLGDEAAVISSDNRVFCEFTYPPSLNWLDHACFKRRRIPSVMPLKGWYATVTYPASRFYFHWMLESLPRMSLLENHVDILDGLFVPAHLENFHRQSLQMLGIPESKLIPVSTESHFQPEHLFVPKMCAIYNPPGWLHHWYKDKYLGLSKEEKRNDFKRKRIYISRSDANARRVNNEDQVIAALAKLGFDSVTLSDKTFYEQARLFNRADIIVAPHGAGLSNIVFCRADAKVIEIFPPRWMAPCFMTLALSVGCNYEYLVAEEAVSTSNLSLPQFRDIEVPVQRLTEALKKHL